MQMTLADKTDVMRKQAERVQLELSLKALRDKIWGLDATIDKLERYGLKPQAEKLKQAYNDIFKVIVEVNGYLETR